MFNSRTQHTRFSATTDFDDAASKSAFVNIVDQWRVIDIYQQGMLAGVCEEGEKDIYK